MYTQVNRKRRQVKVYSANGMINAQAWDKLRRWYPNYVIIIVKGD